MFHTHSPAATLASLFHEDAGAVTLADYEMLKALDGIATHETVIDLPLGRVYVEVRRAAEQPVKPATIPSPAHFKNHKAQIYRILSLTEKAAGS